MRTPEDCDKLVNMIKAEDGKSESDAIVSQPILQIVSLSAVHDSRAGIFLYGLDEKGAAWCKRPGDLWTQVDMRRKGAQRAVTPRISRNSMSGQMGTVD